MKTDRIAQSEWQAYFESVSNFLEGKRVTIRVAALDIGDQIEEENVSLFGMTYDPKDNLFDIALQGLNHMIADPQDVRVVTGDRGIETISIIDGDGREQIIQFSESLMLPSPA